MTYVLTYLTYVRSVCVCVCECYLLFVNVILVSVKTYNALITTVATQRASAEERWSHVLVC